MTKKEEREYCVNLTLAYVTYAIFFGTLEQCEIFLDGQIPLFNQRGYEAKIDKEMEHFTKERLTKFVKGNCDEFSMYIGCC